MARRKLDLGYRIQNALWSLKNRRSVRSDHEVSERVKSIFAQADVRRLHDALASIPDESEADSMRLVGGSVRDLYLGRGDGRDLDFATPLLPDEVEQAVRKAGFHVPPIPRAKSHGTIVAVVPESRRQFEITTLRRDIQTDGRHAEVSFTRDWREDSGRRDFTINALYGGRDGSILDFHNGKEDMRKHFLRFIGDAKARIAEDYLRILRFFRFHATLGWSDKWHTATLAACREAAKHPRFTELSGERVRDELFKILAVEDADSRIDALLMMERTGILPSIVPEVKEGWRYASLHAARLEKIYPPSRPELSRLALMVPPFWPPVSPSRLRLSKEEGKWLAEIRNSYERFMVIRSIRMGLPTISEDMPIPSEVAPTLQEIARTWSRIYVESGDKDLGLEFFRHCFAWNHATAFHHFWVANFTIPSTFREKRRTANLSAKATRVEPFRDLVNRVESRLPDSFTVDGRDLQDELGMVPGEELGHLLNLLKVMQLTQALLGESENGGPPLDREGLLEFARNSEAGRKSLFIKELSKTSRTPPR